MTATASLSLPPRDRAARFAAAVGDDELLDTIRAAVDECAGGDPDRLTRQQFNTSHARARKPGCPQARHATVRLGMPWRAATRGACDRRLVEGGRAGRRRGDEHWRTLPAPNARGMVVTVANRLRRPVTAEDFRLECRVLAAADRRCARQHRLSVRYPSHHEVQRALRVATWPEVLTACGQKTRSQARTVLSTVEAIEACVAQHGATPHARELADWARANSVRFSDWDAGRWQTRIDQANTERTQRGEPPLPKPVAVDQRPDFTEAPDGERAIAVLHRQTFPRAHVVDAVARHLLDPDTTVLSEHGYQDWAERRPDQPTYRAVALHDGLPPLEPDARRLAQAGGPDADGLGQVRGLLARAETPLPGQIIRHALAHPEGFTASSTAHLAGHPTRNRTALWRLQNAGALIPGGRATTRGRPMLYRPAPGLERVLAYVAPAKRTAPDAAPVRQWTQTARDTHAAAQTLPELFTTTDLSAAMGGISTARINMRLEHLAELGAARRTDTKIGRGYAWTLTP